MRAALDGGAVGRGVAEHQTREGCWTARESGRALVPRVRSPVSASAVVKPTVAVVVGGWCAAAGRKQYHRDEHGDAHGGERSA